MQPGPDPPQLDNPHDLPYTRIKSKGRVIYRHPTAGRVYGRGQTPWEAEREQNKAKGGNRWAMWRSKDEWESVKWMATEKVSQASVNKLLKTERYRHAKYSFRTAKQQKTKLRSSIVIYSTAQTSSLGGHSLPAR